MAQTISNISEITNAVTTENEKKLSLTEELQRVNKIKYNLGIVYFVSVVALMVTLFV